MPNLICLGVEKSGTTYLWNILKQNKKIFAIQKETEFFTFFNKKKNKSYHFNNLNEYQKLFKSINKEKYILDVSTTYFSSKNAMKNINKFCKNPKIIISLRNPIDRAYSRYWMEAHKNISFINFSFVKFRKFFLNHGRKNIDKWNNVRIRGMYYNQLKKVFNIFGKKNVLIIFYEDFQNNKLKKKLSEFLGIKIKITNKRFAESLHSKNYFLHLIFNFSFKFSLKENLIINFLKKIKRHLRKKILTRYPPIDAQTRAYLKSYYVNDIRKTEKLLNISLKNWYK